MATTRIPSLIMAQIIVQDHSVLTELLQSIHYSWQLGIILARRYALFTANFARAGRILSLPVSSKSTCHLSSTVYNYEFNNLTRQNQFTLTCVISDPSYCQDTGISRSCFFYRLYYHIQLYIFSPIPPVNTRLRLYALTKAIGNFGRQRFSCRNKCQKRLVQFPPTSNSAVVAFSSLKHSSNLN